MGVDNAPPMRWPLRYCITMGSIPFLKVILFLCTFLKSVSWFHNHIQVSNQVIEKMAINDIKTFMVKTGKINFEIND